jgi:hypothetical protein
MARTLSLPKFLKFKPIQLPAALRPFVRPMLLASLGIHAVVLLFPLSSPPVKVAAPKPKTVKISKLPPLKRVKPLITPRPIRKPPLAVIPPKGLVIPRLAKKASAVAPDPKKSQDLPSLKGKNSDRKDSTQAANSEFQHYPNAVSGCYKNSQCYDTKQPLDKVDQFFFKQFKDKKFAPQKMPSEKDLVVYQFSMEGLTQFLNILFADGRAIYVVSPDKPLTRDDIVNKVAVQIPDDFTTAIMGQLPGATADVAIDQLSDPKAFYTELGGQDPQGFDIKPVPNLEMDSIQFVPAQSPDQLFASYFSSRLSPSYVATSIPSGYGGGLLYEIKKGSLKPFYLCLVPTTSGGGTVVSVWRSNPSGG